MRIYIIMIYLQKLIFPSTYTEEKVLDIYYGSNNDGNIPY